MLAKQGEQKPTQQRGKKMLKVIAINYHADELDEAIVDVENNSGVERCLITKNQLFIFLLRDLYPNSGILETGSTSIIRWLLNL